MDEQSKTGRIDLKISSIQELVKTISSVTDNINTKLLFLPKEKRESLDLPEAPGWFEEKYNQLERIMEQLRIIYDRVLKLSEAVDANKVVKGGEK